MYLGWAFIGAGHPGTMATAAVLLVKELALGVSKRNHDLTMTCEWAMTTRLPARKHEISIHWFT